MYPPTTRMFARHDECQLLHVSRAMKSVKGADDLPRRLMSASAETNGLILESDLLHATELSKLPKGAGLYVESDHFQVNIQDSFDLSSNVQFTFLFH